MNHDRLRGLLWVAVLIGAWTLLLDWYDELEGLRREARTAHAQRGRELSSLRGLNWMAEATRARSVRLDWLGRFIEAETPGLLRVNALEHLKTVCTEAKTGCQISLVGDDGGGTAFAASAARASSRERGGARLPEGVYPIQVKASFNFLPDGLVQLLDRFEASGKLYTVDRVSVNGQRAEVQFTVFGVDAAEARKLRAASAVAAPGAGS